MLRGGDGAEIQSHADVDSVLVLFLSDDPTTTTEPPVAVTSTAPATTETTSGPLQGFPAGYRCESGPTEPQERNTLGKYIEP